MKADQDTKATRILVYGVTGSGKSTLAKALAEKLHIDYTSVDDLTWEPGWIQVGDDVQRLRMQEICSREKWIIDSAYAKWLDIPLRNVELIVGLDFPRSVSLARLTKRTVCRLFDRRPICNGNRESLAGMFSKESILLWHFKSFARKHHRMIEWECDPAAPPILRFRYPKEVDRWVALLDRR